MNDQESLKPVQTAFIGLGGNVGDVLANMQNAIGLLHDNPNVEIIQLSSVYKTPPWGNENQDWFLNACAKLETSLNPVELLALLLETEKSLKRIRSERWGPRTIDLDILLYGDLEIDTKELSVPHPRIHERAFVLVPLEEMSPKMVFKEKSISGWVSELNTTKIVKTDKVLSLPNL